MKTRLSWKPRALGALYCSSACGGGCTREKYDRARREAAGLTRALGPGWKARVWENLGWHYEARKATLKVSPSFGSGYVAYIGKEDHPGGCWTGNGRTPRAAVRAAIREGRRFVDHKAGLVEKAEEAVKR
ncbi:MAG: hypothetical protein ACRD1Z_05070 [Vicinamibacteria bacterium]